MTKGKSDSSASLLPRPDADAVSLHSQHGGGGSSGIGSGYIRTTDRYLDADDDAPELFLDNDLPPSYSDIEPGPEGAAAGDNAAGEGGEATRPGATDFNFSGRNAAGLNLAQRYPGAPQTVRSLIEPRFDADPALLAGNVEQWGFLPPRPFVRLRGTHSETVDRDGKRQKQDVTDFDVKVELTPNLYADARMRTAWRELRTPDDREKVRRGTVFRCQAPERLPAPNALLPSANAADEDPELGNSTGGGPAPRLSAFPPQPDDKPSLQEWCRRYCADPSPLKSFSLQRRMVGFDQAKVRGQMESLVRRTGYRGHLQVTFPVDETGVVLYSDHAFNRWRLNKWIRALCVLTLMVLFTWPYLFFRTKRYEVVTVDWFFSRQTVDGLQYVSLSEDQWYNLWGRAISNAVLGKRQGTLDQADLRAAEGAEPTFEQTGNATVDGALGVVRAGISAMNHVNRQLGWGGDC